MVGVCGVAKTEPTAPTTKRRHSAKAIRIIELVRRFLAFDIGSNFFPIPNIGPFSWIGDLSVDASGIVADEDRSPVATRSPGATITPYWR
jgi:hypothetical protein